MPNKPPRCELISWGKFAQLSRKVAFKIHNAGFEPDLIIAIARGGYMPARVLADYLSVMNVASIKVEHYHGTKKSARTIVRHPLPENVQGKRVLVVDDVSDTGDTFDAALPHIRARLPKAEIRTAVLLHKASCPDVPDFYAHKVVKWRWIIYPWAVIEDLTAFLQEAKQPIKNVAAFAKLLKGQHGLHMPKSTLQDVFDLAGKTPRYRE
ncbi:MAG: phosphoribosyltransferase [Hydrogenophilales bacterium]|nr:phosphoribosyltransferase [Hydrogenophilales bacterium]